MIKDSPEGLIIKLRIIPNSSKNDIVLEEGFIKVKVTAQPIENKANKCLIEYLSKNFKIPRTSIKILKGETSKEKTILLKVADESLKQSITTRLTK